MKYLIAAAVVALAGCDTMTVAEKLPNLSNYQVCEGVVLAPQHVAAQAQQEAYRRGLNCNQYTSAILSQRQASDNATNNLVQQLLTPAAPMQRQTSCRSYRVGNTVQTDCN
jgi:hypothetical protein